MTDIKYRTLIIDDEEPARLFIKELLQSHSNCIEIIGEASNGIEAIELIELLKPDLIFLDIQMPGKDGFEVLQCLTKMPLVVFCTAFDECALQAFETNSIDYLVKPVKFDRLQKTLAKLQGISGVKEQEKIRKLVQSIISTKVPDIPSTFPVKVGDRVIFVKMSEIVFFTAKEKYVEIHTLRDKVYILDQSLNSLEEKLSSQFTRVQRGYIINVNLIKEIKNYMPGKYVILLDDVCNSKVVTGRNYSVIVNNLMKI